LLFLTFFFLALSHGKTGPQGRQGREALHQQRPPRGGGRGRGGRPVASLDGKPVSTGISGQNFVLHYLAWQLQTRQAKNFKKLKKKIDRPTNSPAGISRADNDGGACILLKTTKMLKNKMKIIRLKNVKLVGNCRRPLETHIRNVRLCRHDHQHIFSVFSCNLHCWLTLGAAFFLSPYGNAI
jgi:hypothetical protein